MTPPTAEVILYGVFQALLTRRVPLGVPDYLDAIRALWSDFGLPPLGRDRLRWLTRTLWARTDDERRLIDALFAAIPLPTAEEVDDGERALGMSPERLSGEPEQPALKPGTGAGQPTEMSPGGTGTAATEPRVPVDFRSTSETGGLPVPVVVLRNKIAPETYVMQPQTVVSTRTLATLWRRFRAFTRTGAKTEFDPNATLAERCCQGVLVRPVFRAPRRNRARLLILADVSMSMAPWRPFLETVAHSLPFSRLKAVGLYHFANLPRRSLFAAANLTSPVALDGVLADFLGASLLIISDGGSARGYLSQRRVRETEDFLERAREAMAPPVVVWLNPMPRDRWTGTTADILVRRCRAAFLPLDRSSLIRAVDILRGARAA